MSEILCYTPTYSPFIEADPVSLRPYSRLPQDQIVTHIKDDKWRTKPYVYMDAIDSILNTRPDIKLVVADGRSTDSIRQSLSWHQQESGSYTLELYPERMSQWVLFNEVIKNHVTPETKYFVYSSSDVLWFQDWVSEAIREFEKNPKLQILFPLVSQGDGNIPCQVSPGPINRDPIKPPYDQHGLAPVLNAYVVIFRMDFLRAYGGYPTLFRNCYTESFLHYLCEAIGGEMRILPRGWCFHWGLVDKWEENGSHYYYNEEKILFQETMVKLQMMRAAGFMNKDMLKKLLWKGDSNGS